MVMRPARDGVGESPQGFESSTLRLRSSKPWRRRASLAFPSFSRTSPQLWRRHADTVRFLVILSLVTNILHITLRNILKAVLGEHC